MTQSAHRLWIPLAAAGSLLLAFALAADLLGVGGAPGLGPRQLLLAGVGVLLLLCSAVLGHRGLRERWLRVWRSMAGLSAGQCALLGLWFGLVLGFFEVAHMAARKLISGVLLKQPEHLLWMAPVCYGVLFGMLGALLGLPLLRWRQALRLPVVLFLLVLVGSWSQLLMHPWLDQWATWVLSLGLALQLARRAGARAPGFLGVVRRTTPWLLGLVLLSAVGVFGARAVAERTALAALPAPPSGATNVVLVVLDTTRADHLSSYGYGRQTTPNIDRLAAGGILFEHAIASSPWTLPSHVTMFTGRYHSRTSADWLVPLDDTWPTLAEKLAERGYATGGFVGNLMYCLREHGLGRGFSHYEDFLVDGGTLALSTSIGRYLCNRLLGSVIRELATNHADEVTTGFLDWVERREGRPFFAFLNYIDAHALYLAPPAYAERFGPRSELLEQWYHRTDWGPAEMQGFIDGYDACLAFIDDQVQRLVDHLEVRGLRDDTLIVVVSDHGELFGEHGLTDHGNSLYRPLLHVPCILSLPGRAEGGQRIAEFVSMRDLPATILDLLGAGPGLPGRSLTRHWQGEAPFEGGDGGPSPLLSEVSRGINTPPSEPRSRGDMKSIILGGLQYIRSGDSHEELYDVTADPRREADLVDTDRGRAALPEMRRALDEALR